MNFNVKNQISSSRTAEFNLLNKQIQTPAIILYTSIGSVPHLTPQLLSTLNDNFILSVALENFIHLSNASDNQTLLKKDHRKIIKTCPEIPFSSNNFHSQFNSIHEYLNTSCLIIGDLRDIYHWTNDPNLPCSLKFASCTSNSGGIMKISPTLYANATNILKPDITCSMADISTPIQGNIKKRISKSLEKTKGYLEILLENKKTPVFASLVGSSDLSLRNQSSLQTSQLENIDGYCIPLDRNYTSDVTLLINSSLLHLPTNKPRIVYGLNSISDILSAISCGVDFVDGVLALIYTEKGFAMNIPFGKSIKSNIIVNDYLDLNSTEFKNDFNPIDDQCKCYTCSHHHKSYIHHLLITKEMLAMVLLMLHNCSSLITLMKDIRDSIDGGTFDTDVAEYKKKFCN